MGDKVDYGEFEEGEFVELQQGGDDMDQRRFNDNFVDAKGCTTGGCANQSNPGEEPWLQLMSAIPVPGQPDKIKPLPSGMATPDDIEVGEIVRQLRGADGDDYAIETIKLRWKDFRTTFMDFEALFNGALEALSMEWVGDDFDQFAEQAETVRENIATIMEDLGSADGDGGGSGMLALLELKQQTLYQLQGGDAGEVLYPAPLIWVDNREWYERAEFHVRPAFWNGKCKTIGDACADGSGNDILKIAGFDPDADTGDSNYRDEVRNFEQDRANYYFEYYNSEANGYQQGNMSRDEAMALAKEDSSKQVHSDVDDLDENYQQRLDNVNNDISGRRDLADDEVSGFKPEVNQSKDTTFNNGENPGGDYPGLNPGGGGGMPSAGGSINPPSFDSTSPTAPTTPSFDPPTSASPSTPSPSGFDPDGLDDNPWDSAGGTDPDDLSGGLASGGGGLGGGVGGGLGPGGGAGGGLGGGAGGGLGGGMGAGGMAGGMMGGAGGGRGAGAGAGGGRGAGGRGAGGPKGMGKGMGAGAGGRGMGGGMMGGAGGRGMGGQGEGEQEANTWLTEEDDVWGIGNEEEDPYA